MDKTVIIGGNKYLLKTPQAGNCKICALYGKCQTLFDFVCERYWIDGIEPIYFLEIFDMKTVLELKTEQ